MKELLIENMKYSNTLRILLKTVICILWGGICLFFSACSIEEQIVELEQSTVIEEGILNSTESVIDNVERVESVEEIIEHNMDYQSIEDEVYRKLIQEMVETSTFPATEGIQCNGMCYDNKYSVMDIDDDGKDELLINFGNADSLGGMVLFIYDYDRENGTVYIEHAGWPDMAVYDNGYIKEEASHNHGRSNLDDFWPYSLLKYNVQTDKYEKIANIDAWQYQIAEDVEPDPEFPKERDLDGDGIVYYDISENYYEPVMIMDKAEYEVWCKQYSEGNMVEIIWYPIISEEKYYEMFPSQAVG